MRNTTARYSTRVKRLDDYVKYGTKHLKIREVLADNPLHIWERVYNNKSLQVASDVKERLIAIMETDHAEKYQEYLDNLEAKKTSDAKLKACAEEHGVKISEVKLNRVV